MAMITICCGWQRVLVREKAVATDEGREAAFMTAIRYGHKATVNLLLESGINVMARSSEGNTPLHVAAGAGDVNVIDLLLEHGADIDAENTLRNTPLLMAVKAGHVVAVKHLLEKGADWKVKNKMKETALSAAEASANKAMTSAIQAKMKKDGGLFGLF
jgi:ankyrin repeat protein